MLAWPGRECSLGRGRRARLARAVVLAWLGRESQCSLGRGGSACLAAGGSARLVRAGVLAHLAGAEVLARQPAGVLAWPPGRRGGSHLAGTGRECSLGRGGSARLAGEGVTVLAWPPAGRESLGQGGEGVLAWPGRECSLGRGGEGFTWECLLGDLGFV